MSGFFVERVEPWPQQATPMPELPDVEIWKRYVDANSLHQKIGGVDINAPRMLRGISGRSLAQSLKGNSFSETRRHGKYLFVRFDGKGWLVLHFGMTGFLGYRKESDEPPPYAPLKVHFSNGYRLDGMWRRRLGQISRTRDPAAFVEERDLGPDLLEIGRADFRRCFQGRGGTVKSAFMDQKFLAGLGNVYSDETLFRARINPRAKISNLDESDLSRLYTAMKHVLRLAIERQADPGRLPESWLLTHRRKGGKCPRCGATLRTVSAGGRTAYFCPRCQT